jgi:hypothetical protein
MGYLKYTPYIYLIFALYFVYEAIVKWNDPDATSPWLSAMSCCTVFHVFREKVCEEMKTINSQSSLWKLLSHNTMSHSKCFFFPGMEVHLSHQIKFI